MVCDVKTLQGIQQQIWFLAVSSLPRKHLQWPKIWTQASCAAIPAFVKADRAQIKKIRQVEASPPLFPVNRISLQISSLKEQFAHPAAGKNTELHSTLRPQKKTPIFSWIDFFSTVLQESWLQLNCLCLSIKAHFCYFQEVMGWLCCSCKLLTHCYDLPQN